MARRFEPADARYLYNHRGHLVFVKPDERQYITTEMIRRTSFTATEPELIAQLAALRDAGWRQFVVAIPPGQEDAIEDWARVKNALA